jgi:hypothetical protein
MTPVIPAKAGTHRVIPASAGTHRHSRVGGNDEQPMDSRLRGNDME